MHWRDLRAVLARRLADHLQGWAEALRRLGETDRKRASPALADQGETQETTIMAGLAPGEAGQPDPDLPVRPGETPLHWLAVARGSGPPEHWLKLARQAKKWIGTSQGPGQVPGRDLEREGSAPAWLSTSNLPAEAGQGSPSGELADSSVVRENPLTSPAEVQPAGPSLDIPPQREQLARPALPKAAPLERRPARGERKAAFRLLPGQTKPADAHWELPEPSSRKAPNPPASGKGFVPSLPLAKDRQPPSLGRENPSASGPENPQLWDADLSTTMPGRVRLAGGETPPAPPRRKALQEPTPTWKTPARLGERLQKDEPEPKPNRAARLAADPGATEFPPWQAVPEPPLELPPWQPAPKYLAPFFSTEFYASGWNEPGTGTSQRPADELTPLRGAPRKKLFQEVTPQPVEASHWLPLPEGPENLLSESQRGEDWEVELRQWQHLQRLEREQRGQLWNE